MIKQHQPNKAATESVAADANSTSKVEELARERMKKAAESAGVTATVQWPNEYDGMAYANIIEAWLQAKNIYGGVAQGNRNNMFYQLALDMRYICDFKKEWLLQVMPTWDLPLAERSSVVQSALNRPQGRNMPDALQEAIRKVKSLGDIGDMDEQAVSNEMRNPLPVKLPYVFKMLRNRFGHNPHAMILCSLPALGALCTFVRAEYIDGEMEEPIFYCILTSPQASGKKVVRKLDEMLAFPIAIHDAEQRESMMQYRKELKAAKNSKKQPEEPEVHIRKVPAKISQRVFLERTYNAQGKSLYSFGEELDTLTKAMKGGAWADLSDILRLAFDGGEFGSDYASENSFNAVCKARWCILLAGTWGAVERFFPNLEDGTMTRFMFAQLEDNAGKPLLPRSHRGLDANETAIREEAKRLYDMCQGEPIIISLERTKKALLEWQALQIKIYELGGKTDSALDTLRRRAMLMGFRAALVGAASEGLKDSITVANFAVWVAQEVLDQQMALFAKGLNQVNRHEQSIKAEAQSRLRTNSTLKLLAQLPNVFTLADLDNLRKSLGYTGESHINIHRWTKKGLIECEMKNGVKTYKKKYL